MAKKRALVPSGERNKIISQMMRIRGRMSVSELQELLGVSDMTVRRCLNEMAEDGIIKRIHGGAVLVNMGQNAHLFHQRQLDNPEMKAALAKAVASFIPDGGSIYLDGGTTCFEVARRLPEGLRCFVVTDSFAVLRELRGRTGIEAIIFGGQLAEDDNTVDGPLTAEIAAKMIVDMAIFSSAGFSEDRIENAGMSSLLTKKVMIQTAQRSLCVVDASKYRNVKCVKFCDWDEVSILVTDSRLPEEAVEAIRSKGVEVHVIPYVGSPQHAERG